MNCKNCSKLITRGKWCSDKCRMAFKRTGKPEQNIKPNTNKAEQSVPEQPESEQTLTKTDQTFYDRERKAGDLDWRTYYRFTENRHKRSCAQCNKPYTTSLQLNKYCSYQHSASAAQPIH